jgi:ABC-2 type transport system permease protein
MMGAIFKETLRRQWRQVLYWGIGMGLLGWYITFMLEDVDFLRQYAEIAESMPPVLLQMFGVDSAASLATPEGFIAFGFFSYALLILAVFAVASGMNVTANEEDEGILDIVLSMPIPRWRIIVEKYLAYTLMMVLILASSLVGLWLGMLSSPDVVDMSRLVVSTLNIIPSMLLMIAFTMFMGVLLRRRGTALGVSAVFIVASYFINFLGAAASGSLADTLRAVSFFRYYDAEEVMLSGLNYGNVALLLIVTVVLFAGSLYAFQRRDIGV